MANMTLYGLDASTGQIRAIEAADALKDRAGNPLVLLTDIAQSGASAYQLVQRNSGNTAWVAVTNIVLPNGSYISTPTVSGFNLFIGDTSDTSQYGNLYIKGSLDGVNAGVRVYPRDEAGSPVTYAHLGYYDTGNRTYLGNASIKNAIQIDTNGDIYFFRHILIGNDNIIKFGDAAEATIYLDSGDSDKLKFTGTIDFAPATDVQGITPQQLEAGGATALQIIRRNSGNTAWEVVDLVDSGALRRSDIHTGEVTSGNFDETTLQLAATPNADSDVVVFVNGVQAIVADGVSEAQGSVAECYFAPTGDTDGSTAVTIANITSSHYFYWKGTNATYDLDTSDRIKFTYMSS